MAEKKWNVPLESIKDEALACDLDKKWSRAESVMNQRTKGHELFGLVAHNQNLYEKKNDSVFSEGSTQAIKRKIKAQTIQRVPDGKIITQFDKNSIEQAIIEFLFEHKVLTSEYDGKDMLKNLLRTFGSAYDYGYACVRTGFEKDLDGDVRISYKQIQWNDVKPSPDCDFIEEAEWYMVREWVSKAELEALIDPETGEISDKTYNENTVKYIVENEIKSGIEPRSNSLADRKQSVTPINSVEVRTMYRRGDPAFITYVPRLNAVLRTVDNYDPRKDVPIHFMILEPDVDFPLGCSSIMWTMSQQQFADAFQSVAYQTLLLAAQPPIMGFGNMTPAKIKMKPRAFWPMGTNPSNKIEKFPVETTTITQYGSILENVSANMMKNLNITDATVASDANVMNYSGTAPGVHEQHRDKTITINQFQKRVETFFAEWANHALRSYLACMSGKKEMTVDEKTRRRIWDIEMANAEGSDPDEEVPSIINGDKIIIDFGKLSADMLNFEVRAGSLIESEQETERRNIQEMLVPISQMMNAVSDQNKKAFEDNIMQLMVRLCELSNVDVSQQIANRIDENLVMGAIQATMEEVMNQGQMLQGIQQQLAGQQMQQPQQQYQQTPTIQGTQLPGSIQQQMRQEDAVMQRNMASQQPSGAMQSPVLDKGKES